MQGCLFLMMKLFILAVAFVTLSKTAVFAQNSCKTQYGITLTHYKVDTKAVCTSGWDAENIMTPGSIIPHYGDPGVRV
jgi:hypothetical protein